MVFRLAILLALILGGGPLAAQTAWKDFLQETGTELYWDPFRQAGLLVKGPHFLTFDLEAGLALVEGRKLAALDVNSGPSGTVLTEQGWGTLKSLVKAWTDSTPPAATPIQSHRHIGVIILDPGHGGMDPGTMATQGQGKSRFTLKEKDLTLQVGLALEKLLKSRYPGKTILMTRRTDTYPSLEDRVALAHKQVLAPGEEILFLSIHFNASLNKNARGIEIWHLPRDFSREVLPDRALPRNPEAQDLLNDLVNEEYLQESKTLAEDLGKALTQEVQDQTENRGIREQAWFVVRKARMPSVLVELGFLTNPQEAELLRTDAYLQKLAQGLYNGVAAFLGRFE